MPVETELYVALDVKTDATTIEIKKAFRKMALIHHPDKGGDPEEFKRINNAYSILSDEEKRNLYDKFGKNGLKSSGQVPTDMFSNLFGGGKGGLFNMFRQMNTPKAQAVLYERDVTIEEICTRKIIKIKITRDRLCKCQKEKSTPCKECDGKGVKVIVQRMGNMIQHMQLKCSLCNGGGTELTSCENCKKGLITSSKIFNIHLTSAIIHNPHFVFADEGNESPGCKAGDFIVKVNIKPHELYKITPDRHIIYDKDITLKEALCGYSFLIVHPSGENIPIEYPFVNPTEPIVIKNKGLDETSNFIINLKVKYPKLSEDQRTKLKEILN